MRLCDLCLILVLFAGSCALGPAAKTGSSSRERISINEGWRFYRYDSLVNADTLVYDVRPDVFDRRDDRDADTRPTEAVKVKTARAVLRPWILLSGNDFIKNPDKRYQRPEGNPGSEFPFVMRDFDDSSWEQVDLPHDWAIKGPFYEGRRAGVGGGMGRLPSHGVAWYRKKLEIPESDTGRSLFLDVDGAMSYAMVWLNGHLVGGWPYGYNSWRLDLTPYVVPGGGNQLAIRLDNPNHSARWYPGGGIYRNVWLVKTNPVHVGQWGTYITTREVSEESATIDIEVTVDNDAETGVTVEVITRLFELDEENRRTGDAVAAFAPVKTQIRPGESVTVEGIVTLEDPELWGPPPTQEPNLYVAVTTLESEGKLVDRVETQYGIRSLGFDPDQGVLVLDEIFDVWERRKTPLDFHLVFPEWHEQDTRAFVRRDRNHPSVIIWSYGNEVGEQYTGEEGAARAMRLQNIVREEDPTRPATASMNFAKPGMAMPGIRSASM